MSLDGTFVFDRKKLLLQGLGLIVAGIAGGVVTSLMATGVYINLGFGILVTWGLYLMLRAAKAGRNISEVEGKPCVVCTQAIPSVMVGKFCDKCGSAIHNDCAMAHTH